MIYGLLAVLYAMPSCRWIARLEMTKTPYLSSRAINQKDKGSLLSQLLKLETAKCLYFFDLWLWSWDMALFWYLFLLVDESLDWRWQKRHISVPEPSIKKLKALCFLQLLKLDKAKCLYFSHIWPRYRDIGVFSYPMNTYFVGICK